MKLTEKILLLMSRSPASCDYPNQKEEAWNLGNALCLLNKNFPHFCKSIVNKRIIDFGCGSGYQSLALAKVGANYVLGIDINATALKKAGDLSITLGLNKKVEFTDKIYDSLEAKFDIVISQNSMEHFRNPVESLNKMKWFLASNGKIFITFGPPWYAPYGSHMHFFTKLPWVNILFSEKTVMNVRAYFRNDGAVQYEEIKGGLNKMSVAKFERIILSCGMNVQFKKYGCVKGLTFLGKVPLIRELFVNHISCILA